MSEEYGSDLGFVRRTSDVSGSVRAGHAPRRIKETDRSFSSFKANIRSGRLDSCIRKYNEEYERLRALAAKVDDEREKASRGEMDYSEVTGSIKEYNEQARRLASIGVRVLAFNTDIQKISFAKDSAAKAIRVPGFLIGPLRRLSAAGRERARLEKEAKAEKESAIYESIVKTAEDAIGQREESVIDGDKFNSLAFENVSETVGNILTEPTSDVAEAEEVVTPAEESQDSPVENDDELERSTREAAEQAGRDAAAEQVAALRQKTDEAMNSVYGKKADAAKRRREAAAASKSVNSGDVFAVLGELNKNFGVGIVTSKDGKSRAEMLVLKDGKRSIITPERFSEMLGITDKDMIKSAYFSTLSVARLAGLWERKAAKTNIVTFNNGDVVEYKDGVVLNTSHVEPKADFKDGDAVTTVAVAYSGAYDEDRRALFDYVSNAVMSGMSEEEIKAKAAAELDPKDAEIVSNFVTGNLDIIKADLENVVDSLKEDDLETKKRDVVDRSLVDLAMRKYGHKSDEPEKGDDEPEVEEPAKNESEVVTPVGGSDVVEEEAEKAVVDSNDSYVAKIGILVGEIAELSKNRDRLREALGDEASEQLATLNEAISNKLAQINELALGGIVSLGKDGERTESREDEDKEAQADHPEEEREKVVTPDPSSSDDEDKEAQADHPEEDLEHRDAIEWWSMMAPILDSPEQQRLTEMNNARLDRERAAEQATMAIDRRNWERNRQARIEDGWLPTDEEARARRIEEKERAKEKVARSKLKHCSYFAGLDDIDSVIDGMISESDNLNNAQDVVRMISEKAPQAYAEMEESYRAEKLAELHGLVEDKGEDRTR